MVARVILVLLAFCMSSGCATVYPECKKYPKGSDAMKKCNQDMREWREGIDRANWDLCMQVYSNAGMMTEHRDHSHTLGLSKLKGPDPFDIRRDLKDNNCRQVLRGHWADY